MRAINKDFLREIKNTRSRFLSILILVALAVAFLSGLRATAPDMKKTCDSYLDAQNFMDIQVLSTLGLTEEDLQVLLQQEGIAEGEGAYTLDVFSSGNGADIVTKLYSLPKEINRLTLLEGRLPTAPNECAVEENILSMLSLSLGDTLRLTPDEDNADSLPGREFTIVGQVLSPHYISVERGNSTLGTGHVNAYVYLPEEAFSMDCYTAIFLRVQDAAALTAFSPEYDARVDGVVEQLEPLADERSVLRRESLVSEANEKLADAQKELDDAKVDAAKELGDARKKLRDARLELDDGWAELRDAQETLARESADAQEKIDDAARELTDAQIELDDGEGTYADGDLDYRQGLLDYADGQTKLEDGKKQYKEGKEKLDDAIAQLDEARATLNAAGAQISSGKQQLGGLLAQIVPAVNAACAAMTPPLPEVSAAAGEANYLLTLLADPALGAAYGAIVDGVLAGAAAQLTQGIAEAAAQAESLTQTIAYLEAALALAPEDAELAAQLEAAKAGLAQAQTAGATLSAQLAALPQSSAALLALQGQLTGGERELASGWSSFQGGYEDYLDGKKKLEESKIELDDAEKELADAAKKLDDARLELRDGRRELDDGWVEFEDGLKKLQDAELELRDKVADANREIADAQHELREGEVEYNDGLADYADGKREADEKIGDGERELADARRKVADIGTCSWYVLSRDSNPGYLGYGQDADRMANLASVFPLLFFLVAALVCLTTMTRMVEEQRTQIGCLKALGYGRLKISRKYIGYGLLPSLLGGAVGLLLGYTLFPKMIFTAYQIMYRVPAIELHTYPEITFFSLLAAVACTTASSIWACFATLSSTPANLMRPRTPPPGKRVLLEYIRPLWRRMSFNLKVTARNLFRYQKRFWMTVIGIAGCTALIIAGFGLRSSLLMTMDTQYNDLYHYSAQLALEENVLPEERLALDRYIAGNPDITGALPCYLSSATAETALYSLSAYIQVVDPTRISQFVDLRDRKSGTPLQLTDDGAILNEKLAEKLGVSVGDSLTVEGDTRETVKVAGITEHYLAHFIYMTPAYYEQVFGKTENNAYLLTFVSDDSALCDRLFTDFMALPGVVSATRSLDTRDTYMHSMERVDFVVGIVILSAAALAMVVLYNLANINITERLRELATIKVLGFYDSEVSAYVYRENVVLTAVGIALGIVFGHFLHVWLVKSVEIELMMFGRETDPRAYLYAALLTILFSVAVNLIAHLKMKKIDMVESLKSAE